MNEKSIISLRNSNHVALVAWGISIIFMENRNMDVFTLTLFENEFNRKIRILQRIVDKYKIEYEKMLNLLNIICTN